MPASRIVVENMGFRPSENGTAMDRSGNKQSWCKRRISKDVYFLNAVVSKLARKRNGKRTNELKFEKS